MSAQTVEQYIIGHPNWEKELKQLRELLFSTELQEEIKWGAPVYTLKNKNVVGIGAFKNHCSLWFFQGALLQEHTSLLENAQEGKTKALRQIRFSKGEEIPVSELRQYVLEAIRNHKEGKEIKPVKNIEVDIPEELAEAFAKDPALEVFFQELSPGRKREYCEYVASAKRQPTKLDRIEKIVSRIKNGEGLNDRYKK